jgi:hypothetical protein
LIGTFRRLRQALYGRRKRFCGNHKCCGRANDGDHRLYAGTAAAGAVTIDGITPDDVSTEISEIGIAVQGGGSGSIQLENSVKIPAELVNQQR